MISSRSLGQNPLSRDRDVSKQRQGMFPWLQQTFVREEDCLTSPKNVCVGGYAYPCSMLPVRDYVLCPARKICPDINFLVFFLIKNLLLIKHGRARWLDIGLVLFMQATDLNSVSANWPISGHLDLMLVNNPGTVTDLVFDLLCNVILSINIRHSWG